MKTQSVLHLYPPLKKVHGWCKRQGMTDPEMYFQCTFREFLRRYGMLLTQIKTRNNQYGGHHTFTFTPAPGTEIFGDTNKNWNQYSTYTFLPWIISNMRILR